MEAQSPSPRPPIEWDTPLNQPLNFQFDDSNKLRAGEALLANGNYTAIRLVKYSKKTTCDGCGRLRQAQECAILRNDETGEELHMGMNCMGKYYKIQADQVKKHAAIVRNARRRLLGKLKLRDASSIEEAIARVIDLALAYLPYPEMHVKSLRNIDTFTPSKVDQDLIIYIQNISLYHREWKDEPERALRRWSALQKHPMLYHLNDKERKHVSLSCIRAINNKNNLPEEEVKGLNNWLQRASIWTPPFRQLVVPEEYSTLELYELAVIDALEDLVNSGKHFHMYWSTPVINHPTQVVSAKAGEIYTVAAVAPKHGEQLRLSIKVEHSYKENFHTVIIREGANGTHTESDVYRRSGNLDLEEDDPKDNDLLRRGRSYNYVTLSWALVENYTPTYTAWRQWGREYLEQYI